MLIKNFDIKFYIIIILSIVSAIVSWKLYFKEYRQADTVDINVFPKRIGVWTSEDIPISQEDYAILETRNAFIRRYTDDKNNDVYLYIVYSQHNRKVSHPPELCYTGEGNLVISKTIVPVYFLHHKAFEAVRLLMEQGQTEHIAYYWFKIGNSFTPSYWRQQGLIAIKSLLGKPASSALIRVSAVIQDRDIKTAEANVQRFVKLIIPLLNKYLP